MVDQVSRRVAALLLVLLAGSLLAMHGLEAAAGGASHPGAAAPARGVAAHEHTTGDPAGDGHDHGGCIDCAAAHGLAACLAVLVAVAVVRAVRGRCVGSRPWPAPPGPPPARSSTRFPVFRPPDPAWVRLSVMRC